MQGCHSSGFGQNFPHGLLRIGRLPALSNGSNRMRMSVVAPATLTIGLNIVMIIEVHILIEKEWS